MVNVGHPGSRLGCVAECSTSSRCGLMLTLATNLLLWLLAVTNDSVHREIETEVSALMEKFSGTGETVTAPRSLNVHTHTCVHATLPQTGEAQ